MIFLSLPFAAQGITLAIALITLGVLEMASAAPVTAAEPMAPSVVKVVRTNDGYQLIRNGQPYFVKGAGGDSELPLLESVGGNSVRTWGADNLQPLLDQADKLGLTVTVGIWLGHEEQGFDYHNAQQVQAQYEAARKVILEYRDDPAVLIWAIGNEMEGYGQGDDPAIWSAVENIARMVKELDPNHPTMTVIAEIGGQRVQSIDRYCPDIDIIGINSYGGAPSLGERYRAAGGTKPYILTEFGPPGVWELGKNSWGVVPEATSTQKAELYRKAYEGAVESEPGLCLGSYAFLWGHKQEATSTWFGMLLPDGSRLAAVDTMGELWSGRAPAYPCPVIKNLSLNGQSQVGPGAMVTADLDAESPCHSPLSVRWVLQADPGATSVGGVPQAVPRTFPNAVLSADSAHATIRMPDENGGYRLYAYIEDDHKGAAVANIPLYVAGGRAASNVPLTVYGDGDPSSAFTPSGWMGDTSALKIDQSCATDPHSGNACIRVDYNSPTGWAGVAWQDTPGDWGSGPGGRDLTGATRLSFWARGQQGGEEVSFSMGLLGRDKPYGDSASAKLGTVALGQTWQHYEIDLSGQDLSRIKTGFVFVVTGQGRPVTFYLDDISYQ